MSTRTGLHNGDVMKTIAERLKYAREHKEWTQGGLAVAAGVSQSTVGNIEAGIREGRGSLPKLAKALSISHDWLADGEGEMLQNTTSNQTVPTTPNVSAASTEMSLGQTLARLGQELGRASPQTRAAVADLLSRYAQNPAQGQSLAQAIEMLVQSDTEKTADA